MACFTSSDDVQGRMSKSILVPDALAEPQPMCSTALPMNSRSTSRRATVPISLHEASTAICGRNFFAADQIGEQPQANAGPLDAHQFVEQGKPVEPHPPVAKKLRLSNVVLAQELCPGLTRLNVDAS